MYIKRLFYLECRRGRSSHRQTTQADYEVEADQWKQLASQPIQIPRVFVQLLCLMIFSYS